MPIIMKNVRTLHLLRLNGKQVQKPLIHFLETYYQ